jgi:hypothetical protein
LASLSFFLWSYVKDKVYATRATGVEDLKTRIRDVITTINRGMLARTWEELEFQLDVLHVTQGAHIEVRTDCMGGKKKIMYPSNKISFTFFLAIYNF